MSGKGMSYLNKKSWHTGGMKMIAKVWEAEEKAKEEQKKIELWRKEKEEERKVEELRRLQANAGLMTKEQLERMDVRRLEWMYAGAAAFKEDEAKETEAYLLGKVKKEEPQGVQDLKALASAPGAMLLGQSGVKQEAGAATTGVPTTAAAAAVADNRSRVKAELEQSTLLREDPLMSLMRTAEARKAAVTNNPHLMAKMREEVLREKLARELLKQKKRDEKKAAKKAKKEAKKRERHERKRTTRSRSRSSSRSSSDDDSRSPSPARIAAASAAASTLTSSLASNVAAPAATPSSSLAAKYGLLNPNAIAPSAALVAAHTADTRRSEEQRQQEAERIRQRDSDQMHAAWSTAGTNTLEAPTDTRSGLYHPSGEVRTDTARTSERASSRHDEPRRSRERPTSHRRSRSRSRSRNRHSSRRHDSRSQSPRRTGDAHTATFSSSSRHPPRDHRSRSRSREYERRRRVHSPRRHSQSRSPRRSRDDASHHSSYRRDSDRRRSRERERERDGKRRRSSRSRDRSINRQREPEAKKPRSDAPTTNVTPATVSSAPVSTPAPTPVAPAPRSTSQPAVATARPASSSHRSSRPTLTPEERAARLAAMANDAVAHEAEVRARALEAVKAAAAEEAALQQRQAALKPNEPASVEFLQKLNANVYSGSHETLEQRLNKNKHYRQKGSIEEQGFL